MRVRDYRRTNWLGKLRSGRGPHLDRISIVCPDRFLILFSQFLSVPVSFKNQDLSCSTFRSECSSDVSSHFNETGGGEG